VSSSLAIGLLAGIGVIALAGVGSALRFRRELLALRARHAETERVSRAKSRRVGWVTHELRTPLTALIGFAELLRDGRAGEMNSRQREYLEVVHTSAGHLLALVDETLDASSVEAGRVRLQPQPVNPDAVAADCVAALTPAAQGRRIALEHTRAALGEALLDAARLRQVIDNFLSNALKFTEPGGRVVLSLQRRDGRLCIAVADTGIGIAPADLERIFQEFVQLHDRRDAGSGLGLALTRRVVHAQGGGVSVESAEGEGSTFTAWLPWVDAPAAGDRAPDPFAPATARRVSWRRETRAPGREDAASRPASARAARP
jgi:signal transduction histidine kinase